MEFQSFESLYTTEVFSLQFGNEFEWSVIGGTNFWSDYSEKYQTSFEVLAQDSDEKLTDVLGLRKAGEKTTQFHTNVRCMTPKEMTVDQHVRLQMNQSSKLTRKLLIPASHSTTVEIHCDAPARTRLLWAQRWRDSENWHTMRD